MIATHLSRPASTTRTPSSALRPSRTSRRVTAMRAGTIDSHAERPACLPRSLARSLARSVPPHRDHRRQGDRGDDPAGAQGGGGRAEGQVWKGAGAGGGARRRAEGLADVRPEQEEGVRGGRHRVVWDCGYLAGCLSACTRAPALTRSLARFLSGRICPTRPRKTRCSRWSPTTTRIPMCMGSSSSCLCRRTLMSA